LPQQHEQPSIAEALALILEIAQLRPQRRIGRSLRAVADHRASTCSKSGADGIEFLRDLTRNPEKRMVYNALIDERDAMFYRFACDFQLRHKNDRELVMRMLPEIFSSWSVFAILAVGVWAI
jgi:hypothetical protein